MTGFAIKACFNLRDGLTRGRREDKRRKSFLAGGCRKEVSVITYKGGSVDGFGGEAHERCLMFRLQTKHGRGAKFLVAVVVVVSRFSK